jgi:hypothetical protein
MALNLFDEKGVPLERQEFDWRDLVRTPTSKLNDDAFTKVRIVLMNGIESEAVRFQSLAARMNGDLRLTLAQIRRVEHHQQTLVNWLLPPDLSPLETTIVFEQVAIEVTAHAAEVEPDPYHAQVYRFGMLEDFDHLHRFAALLDRLEGKDANNILQSYTDVLPGRPTSAEHRAPIDDLRRPYARATASPQTKLNALTLTAAELAARDYYMTIGPQFADPLARQLYAEIASIEEQHVTSYGSLVDPTESILEQWMLHEAKEVWNYWSCVQQEQNPRIKAIWQRFLDYELGHLFLVRQLFERIERRDPAEVLPKELPDAVAFKSHRAFVRKVLDKETELRAVGMDLVPMAKEPTDGPSALYRARMNKHGSPSEIVATDWRWSPGTELNDRATALMGEA